MGVSGHAQLEIQAESERLLANALSVLEVESSSTFFPTRMSESQSDFFFSMLRLEHAIAPVRATEFAEVETGLDTGYANSAHISNRKTALWIVGES